MTNIPVGNMGNQVGNKLQATGGVQKSGELPGVKKVGSFQDAMDLLGQRDTETAQKQQPAETKQAARPRKELSENLAGKERIVRQKAEPAQAGETVSDEEVQKVQETAKEIIEKIADELDVSPEEVVNAMQVLGLQVVDLGNSNQMAKLMTELLDLTDPIQIVTDATLFDSCIALSQNADELFASLANELEIPQGELTQRMPLHDLAEPVQTESLSLPEEIVSEDAVRLDDTVISETNDVGETAVIQQLSDTETAEQAPVQTILYTETSRIQPHTEHVERRAESRIERSAQEEFEEHGTEHAGKEERKIRDTAEVSTDTESMLRGTQHSREERMRDQDEERGQHVANKGVTTFSGHFEQAAAIPETIQPLAEPGTAEDILRQIGDYVRTNVTPNVKEMEIQLSPANLGQVHISIVSKNGAVTAQLTAENEIVKSALEAQVVQLKERLETQGIKIEAVEVTVASHEFERNLDENSENRQDREEQQKQSSTRHWNLSDMGDEPVDGEELTDAERVELDMMKLGGGRLNYMV